MSGYMTKAKMRGEQLEYSISSLLAGPESNTTCRVTDDPAPDVGMVDCVGIPDHERVDTALLFQAATKSYRELTNGIDIRRLLLVLVPMGVGYSETAKFTEAPEALSVKQAIRYQSGSKSLQRHGVRVYVHELVHLNNKASNWKVSKEKEEYLASLMESCVEVEVFGDSNGYVLDGDLSLAGYRGLSSAQDRSVDGFFAAYQDVRSFANGTGPVRASDTEFNVFCRAAFLSVKR